MRRRHLYGREGEEPAGFLDKDLFESCSKFFDRRLWIQLAEGWSVERYPGFHSEHGIFDCYCAYARYLLRGFKDHPNWTAQDEAVSVTYEREAHAAKAYMIWGSYEYFPNCRDWRQVPIEGYMKGMKLRNGKLTQPGMPVYPRIEEHSM
jgi:hypothetical protein